MATRIIAFILTLLFLAFCIAIMIVPSSSVFDCGNVVHVGVANDAGNYYTEDQGIREYIDVRGCSQLITYQGKNEQLIVTVLLCLTVVCVLVLVLKDD